jgi:hypothetical protein
MATREIPSVGAVVILVMDSAADPAAAQVVGQVVQAVVHQAVAAAVTEDSVDAKSPHAVSVARPVVK